MYDFLTVFFSLELGMAQMQPFIPRTTNSGEKLSSAQGKAI